MNKNGGLLKNKGKDNKDEQQEEIKINYIDYILNVTDEKKTYKRKGIK